jgi:hypothetical protein
MSTAPQSEFRSQQYEFTDEQNRTVSGLADAMRVVAGLLQLAGLVFVIFAAILAVQAGPTGGGIGPVIGLGAAALICLAIGFWTSGSARSFRKIAETKNEDMWHLMNALGKLQNMYGLLRAIIITALVLAVAGVAVVVYQMIRN